MTIDPPTIDTKKCAACDTKLENQTGAAGNAFWCSMRCFYLIFRDMELSVHDYAMELAETIGKKSVLVRYADRKHVATTRVVSVLSMMRRRGDLSVLVWCHRREDCRWFRITRMEVIKTVKKMPLDPSKIAISVAGQDERARLAILSGTQWLKQERRRAEETAGTD